MAVLETQQKMGFGEALVKHCETYCNDNQVDLIWFNARTAAVGFYQKMNADYFCHDLQSGLQKARQSIA